MPNRSASPAPLRPRTTRPKGFSAADVVVMIDALREYAETAGGLAADLENKNHGPSALSRLARENSERSQRLADDLAAGKLDDSITFRAGQ